MRISIFFLLVFITLYSTAQIKFYGEAEPLKGLNSPYDERFFVLHPSETEIILGIRNHPDAIGGNYNPVDLWLSKKDSAWSAPSSSVNVDPNNAVVPLGFVNSARMILYAKRITKLGANSTEIIVADYLERKLTNHRKIKIPYFNNKSKHISGTISDDGKHILLAMEGTTTFGVEDLYVIHLTSDGSWTAPRNLGYRVNTAFQEYSPFLAADNETLIFASNGRGGEGSFDLFMTSRIDDTWQNWTEPVNLGPAVNTKGAETSFAFIQGARHAYFSSTTDSDGYGDIKRIQIEADIETVAEDETVFLIQNDEEIKKIFSLKDISSERIVSGKIKIQGFTDGFEETPYEYVAESVEDVTITARSPGYLDFQAVITASELGVQDLIVIPMKPLEVGTTVNLDNVLFYQGTANFIEGSEGELDQVVNMMKENPNIRILIKGHTDNVGNPGLNLQLSQERARVVLEYIASNGIDMNRLEGKGFGGTEPVASNDSEENRKLNRRVEFTIIEN